MAHPVADRPQIQPQDDRLPPFRLVVPDKLVETWQRHVVRAAAENITVIETTKAGPGRWLVRIQGSKGDTYRVRVRPGAAPSYFEASCSCPAGIDGRHWCKHIALVLVDLGILPPYLATASANIWEEAAAAIVARPKSVEDGAPF